MEMAQSYLSSSKPLAPISLPYSVLDVPKTFQEPFLLIDKESVLFLPVSELN